MQLCQHAALFMMFLVMATAQQSEECTNKHCEDDLQLHVNLLQYQKGKLSGKHVVTTTPRFVVDVGAPRTGTQSMYTAFQILKLNPLHSGYHRSSRKPVEDYLFHNGSKEAALATLDGYDGAMDEPYQFMYREVMEAIPDAKFVLTLQKTPQDWYRSYNRFMSDLRCLSATVHGLQSAALQEVAGPGPIYEAGLGDSLAKYWGCYFDAQNQTAEMVSHCMSMYNAHNEAVQREIPAEKLLVFDMADGWAPLCEFLDLPVPDEPFPHVDEFAEPLPFCQGTNTYVE